MEGPIVFAAIGKQSHRKTVKDLEKKDDPAAARECHYERKDATPYQYKKWVKRNTN